MDIIIFADIIIISIYCFSGSVYNNGMPIAQRNTSQEGVDH